MLHKFRIPTSETELLYKDDKTRSLQYIFEKINGSNINYSNKTQNIEMTASFRGHGGKIMVQGTPNHPCRPMWRRLFSPYVKTVQFYKNEHDETT